MSLWSKIKSLFGRKKNVVKEIENIQDKQHEHISSEKFDSGLRKSSSSLANSVNNIAKKYRKLNQDLIDQIEETLLLYDVGSQSTQKILDAIIDEIKYQNVTDPELIKTIIIDKLFVYYIQNTNIDTSIKLQDNKSNVILITGANGVGKTTSIAKLAQKFKQDSKSVCLVEGDTFRAGAVEQLKVWANKLNVPIFVPEKANQDPASVIYKGIEYATQNKIDVVICDTSGRLQNKTNLMNELKKINDIIKKFDSNQPCESLLVIDATTGQSGISQARAFNEVTKITGIILTKMDSTSKGGIILSIKDAFNLPVKYIGLGENLNDLQEFDLEKFLHGLINSLEV